MTNYKCDCVIVRKILKILISQQICTETIVSQAWRLCNPSIPATLIAPNIVAGLEGVHCNYQQMQHTFLCRTLIVLMVNPSRGSSFSRSTVYSPNSMTWPTGGQYW